MATEVKRLWAYPTSPFGDPTLSAANNGTATWVRGDTPTLSSKGSSGWLAKLTGGTQTNDDYGRVNIPVNEMHLPSFATAKWSYYMTATESMGVNIVIWVHDPTDFDKRAEITQIGGHTDLEKAAGWNAFEFSNATGGMFYYGENVSSDLDAGTQYTWSQFIQDDLFKTWDIYRITIEHGWEVSGVFSSVYVAEVQLDGKTVVLKPSAEELAFLQVDEGSGAQRVIPAWIFGKPTLYMMGNGRAHWARGSGALGTQHKGSTGWVARLFGGTQTGYDDAASLVIPVNEMPLPDLDSMSWSYHMKNTELFGCQIQIYVHDPAQPENRADIIQSGAAVLLDKGQGWNSHILNEDTPAQFFWYGENVTGEGLTEGPSNLYSLAEFKADTLFSTWTIYRITLNNGYYDGDAFEDTYVADVKINGTVIPLYPDIQRFKRAVTTQKTLECLNGYAGGDVMSNSDTEGSGTDWDFDFGTSGKVVQAVIATETNGITAAVDLYLFSSPPTCELDDNAVSDAPVVADLPYFIGLVEFSAMVDVGAGPSYAIATGLSIAFDTPTIYGVAVDSSGQDFDDNKTCDITLTAELET